MIVAACNNSAGFTPALVRAIGQVCAGGPPPQRRVFPTRDERPSLTLNPTL
jgi:hypothetical protein